ncbi:MucBP domain-containing protein [Vagococcus xieshaowenii]|uniref:MucBP domain-containing protein n=1 Tax=Vagococcus xieshaowenii TaxID=2562451 RepID=A0AAJ5EF65_9ENTE|nr:MucBP domain-containing protein [Vagococcus xieshaowenii]QCA27982.1 hypothetical protein E4Z98_00925 [Vagococcus xieshaowenii]TFZ41251.1 hypothetical protein E4031_05200 [Vagococcus xieshaowenii]
MKKTRVCKGVYVGLLLGTLILTPPAFAEEQVQPTMTLPTINLPQINHNLSEIPLTSDETITDDAIINPSETTTSNAGAGVNLAIWDASLNEEIAVMPFYGQPGTILTIPIDTSMGQLISVTGGDFAIQDPGAIVGTYPNPNEIIDISVRIMPVAAQPVQIDVNFIDEDGKAVIGAPLTTYYGKPGETITVTPSNIPGYTFSDEHSFAVPEDAHYTDFISVDLMYTRNDLTLTIQHLDENRQPIIDDELINGKIGDEISIKPVDIEGYTYKQTSRSLLSFTFGSTDETISLEYVRKQDARDEMEELDKVEDDDEKNKDKTEEKELITPTTMTAPKTEPAITATPNADIPTTTNNDLKNVTPKGIDSLINQPKKTIDSPSITQPTQTKETNQDPKSTLPQTDEQPTKAASFLGAFLLIFICLIYKIKRLI